MNKLKNLIYLMGLSFLMILPSCSDQDDEITNIDYDRLFSPTELKLQIANRTSIVVIWNAVKDADSYVIEVFNGSSNFEGTPILTFKDIVKNGTLTDPFMIQGLDGEADYSVQIKAVGTSIPDSKWASGTIKTNPEQIFLPIDPEELLATEVTLRWPAGQEVTEIILTPGDITHPITADEKAAGAATITELTGKTDYTATLKNGVKTRGTLTFTTKIDLGDATGIYPEDDLKAILDEAEDGDEFVLFPGTYNLGAYEVTKSLKISGYESNDQQIIYGQITCGSAINVLELRSLTFRGDGDAVMLGQFFNLLSGCDIKNLSIIDCDISNYLNQLIYNNVAGSIGNFIISNSLIHHIEGSGGDGIDFRGGTLASMKVENTTFYEGFRTFVRMQAKAGPISFTNCTFYKISNLDNSNNHGLFRVADGSTFQVSNCLFNETGVSTPTNVASGNWCRQASNMKATASYSNNIYYNCPNLWVGLYTNPSQCSASEADPQFKDPASGDFTVQSIVVNAGDPRWLP